MASPYFESESTNAAINALFLHEKEEDDTLQTPLSSVPQAPKCILSSHQNRRRLITEPVIHPTCNIDIRNDGHEDMIDKR